MALTFIEIERRKTWRISVMFMLLLVMYLLLTFSFFLAPALLFGSLDYVFNPLNFSIILIGACILAGIHFWFSMSTAVSSVIEQLGAVRPDPEDGIHRRLLNVMDEIHIATGQKRIIQCMVIPSLSLNALAAADSDRQAVIAITEGLLSRLTRPQLESVMAHEAYHVLSGDCTETTLAASVFGIHASALDHTFDLTAQEQGIIRPLFWLYWMLLRMSQLLSMLISREREYRADAASVRMTRDPLSLAEALYLFTQNWTGMGRISQGIEMLCIVAPRIDDEETSEDSQTDLMSTHPPLKKRIGLLLEMAHTGMLQFERRMQEKQSGVDDSDNREYFALDNNRTWQGPFTPDELFSLAWFSPLTWVSSFRGRTPGKAYEIGLLKPAIAPGSKEAGTRTGSLACPRCNIPLAAVTYEQTPVYQCSSCRGVLVSNDRIPRIITRHEEKWSDRTKALAQAVMSDNLRKISERKRRHESGGYKSVLKCTKCGNPMFRNFYSPAYLIEIDKCSVCRTTWFDADELDMLQCVIENTMTAQIEIAGT